MPKCKNCKREIWSLVCPHCTQEQRPVARADLFDRLGTGQPVTVEGMPALIVRVSRARKPGPGEMPEPARVWVRFADGTLSAYPEYSLLPDPSRQPGQFAPGQKPAEAL